MADTWISVCVLGVVVLTVILSIKVVEVCYEYIQHSFINTASLHHANSRLIMGFY